MEVSSSKQDEVRVGTGSSVTSAPSASVTPVIDPVMSQQHRMDLAERQSREIALASYAKWIGAKGKPNEAKLYRALTGATQTWFHSKLEQVYVEAVNDLRDNAACTHFSADEKSALESYERELAVLQYNVRELPEAVFALWRNGELSFPVDWRHRQASASNVGGGNGESATTRAKKASSKSLSETMRALVDRVRHGDSGTKAETTEQNNRLILEHASRELRAHHESLFCSAKQINDSFKTVFSTSPATNAMLWNEDDYTEWVRLQDAYEKDPSAANFWPSIITDHEYISGFHAAPATVLRLRHFARLLLDHSHDEDSDASFHWNQTRWEMPYKLWERYYEDRRTTAKARRKAEEDDGSKDGETKDGEMEDVAMADDQADWHMNTLLDSIFSQEYRTKLPARA